MNLKFATRENEWKKITDNVYPYEFSIRLPDSSQNLKLKWIAEDLSGIAFESRDFELMN